jgi:hypothetical protein
MSIYAVNGKVPVAAWIPSRDTAGNGTSTLTDLVGSNNGTLTNMDAATDWVADTDAGGIRALDFDGSNDTIETSYTPPNVFSISLWFLNSVTYNIHNRGIFSTYDSITPSYNGVYLATTNDGGPGLHMWTNSNFRTRLTASFVVNQYFHCCITSSGSSVAVYIDGALVNTVSSGTTHASVLSIGRSRFDNNFWVGRIDDIRIFNTVLTANDISYLWNGGNGRGRTQGNSFMMGIPI